jgi:hypothetical protein
MAKIIRIVARPTKPDDELNITLEVAVEENKIRDGMVFFGFLGSLKDEENLYPFVLLIDGQLDFGSCFEDAADRYGRSNIRERRIEIGALFSISMTIGDPPSPKESTYLITQIIRVD